MATECIEAVSTSVSKDPKFLYACCLDAQQSGDLICTLRALKLLAEKYEYSRGGEIHFPAVLRSTIRVQISILEGKGLPGIAPNLVAQDLCDTFEGGMLIPL